MTYFFLTPTYSQDKKDLKISLGAGLFSSHYYTNSKQRPAYNFSLEYSISKRHKISADYLSGKHQYFDNFNSNNSVPITTRGYEKNANSIAEYSIFSTQYKYQLLDKKRFSINTGIGLGLMTQVVVYPYTTIIVAGPDILEMIDFRQSS